MEDLQDNLSIVTIKGEGVLVESTKRQGGKIPCNICIQQLYNGQIRLEFNTTTDGNVNKWFECYGPLDFVGKSNKGDYLQIKNLRYADVTKHTLSFTESSVHFYLKPPFLEIIHQPESEAYQLQTATCEITNLYLERTNSFEINLPEANIQIQQNPDKYATVANLMRLTGTSGVLSEMQVQPLQNQSESELEQLINAVCWLLSLSQRTHVSCVTTHWKDKIGKIIKSVYKIPPFYYSRPSAEPLIPDDCVAEFLEKSMDNYQQKFFDWNLFEAIEYYLQAMQINSMWAKSLGYFTALETLKSAFQKKYIIKNQKRPTYRQILRPMYKNLDIKIAEHDLDQLIDLRNQIIHNGSPNKKLFQDSLKNVPSFSATLIEPSFMAILGYSGKINSYEIIFH